LDSRAQARLWSLAPALIALVGVLVGVLATGSLDYLRAERESSADLREAKRLVALEVGDNAVSLALLDVDRIAAPDGFHSTMWSRYRPLLARELSEADWWLAASFYNSLEELRAEVAYSPLTRLSDGDLSGVREERRQAEDLRVMLGEHPTGLLSSVGTRRIAYRPPRAQRDPDWAAFSRFVYKDEFASR
jgi:hypothetical protein